MKITTTMTKGEFNKWILELQSVRKPTKAEWNSVPVSKKAKARLMNEAKAITMQEVMVSWTYEDWRKAK
jgi:hypothetical protein